jgi:hypothetical protein
MSSRGIQIEDKKEIAKPERLGRSPDWGDAIIIAWSEGERALIAAQRKRARGLTNQGTQAPVVESHDRGTGWMGN